MNVVRPCRAGVPRMRLGGVDPCGGPDRGRYGGGTLHGIIESDSPGGRAPHSSSTFQLDLARFGDELRGVSVMKFHERFSC